MAELMRDRRWQMASIAILLFVIGYGWVRGYSGAADDVICAGTIAAGASAVQAAEIPEARPTPGSLAVLNENGETVGLCPLKHTDVKGEVSGFVARVEVRQQFHNPYDHKIEAVYTFPLSQNAAVDDMLMKVGDRTIRGEIRERGEARRIYEAAKEAGHVAALLDQERPNIFTQSVANIMPGEDVDITIRYVELLKFEDGYFEFAFPMVVGPRYIPGEAISSKPDVPPELEGQIVNVPEPEKKAEGTPSGTGWAAGTDQVPDASRITPQVTAPGTRAGHDISVTVEIDAGVPLGEIESKLHEVTTHHDGNIVSVKLKTGATIPNKDFILRYSTASDEIGDTVLTHASEAGQFFALVLQPPKRVTSDRVTPKEIVFVVDTSGSMHGEPIEKAKETMFHSLANLNPEDTFNVITFSGDTRILFPQPVRATSENIAMAKSFLEGHHGSGGTEMMKAIRAALDPSDSQQHVRIVSFMTDGYVGNDMAIIDEIQRHPNARIFSFGIGQSVNRFLLDNMAREGRGEVDYVTLGTPGEEAAKRFYERVRHPVLTDIEVDWGSLPVTDIFPERILDLFGAKPVVVHGRFTEPVEGKITLRGKMAGKPFAREVTLSLPETQASHEALGSLWARAKIDHLMGQEWAGIQSGNASEGLKMAIVELGVGYRLVTQYTSFVAVEEMVVTEGGKPRTIQVPVEMPEGVTYEGVFGVAGNRLGRASRSLQYRAHGAAGPAGPAMKAAVGVPAVVGVPGPPYRGPQGDKGDKGGVAFEPDVASSPEQKLAPELRGLADRVEREGRNGNFKRDSIEVRNGIVEVAVWLADDSAKNMKKLEELGFRPTTSAKTVKMVIGKIEVTKLAELAELEFVLRIEPPPA